MYAVNPETGRTEFLHTFAPMDGFGDHPVGGLVQAANGWIYGLMESGGPAGTISHGIIHRIDPASHAVELVHAFGTLDAWTPKTALMRASDGALYGTASSGGPDNAGAIFRLTPATGVVQIVHHLC